MGDTRTFVGTAASACPAVDAACTVMLGPAYFEGMRLLNQSLCAETPSPVICYGRGYCVVENAQWVSNTLTVSNCTLIAERFSNSGPGFMGSTGLPKTLSSVFTNPSLLYPSQCARKSAFAMVWVPESKDKPGNVAHELMQWHSVFLSRRAIGLGDDDINNTLIIADTAADYQDSWGLGSLFSSNPFVLARNIPDGTCFDKVLLTMAGGCSPLWTHHWKRDNCRDIPLIKQYTHAILKRFDALSIPPPKKPTILWIDRSDVGTRVIQHQDEVISWIRAEYGDRVTVCKQRMKDLSFREQVHLVRSSNILIGASSGLIFALLLADEGVVVELQFIFSTPTEAAHSRNIARYAGKIHIMLLGNGPPRNFDDGRAQAQIETNVTMLKRSVVSAIDAASSFDMSAGLLARRLQRKG